MSELIKVVVTSDTHTFHDQLNVPPGDIFIHCGDFTKQGTMEEIASFNVWLGTLPHEHKIVVGGNLNSPFTIMLAYFM